ncbi:MAG: TylF/MycF/NovP-related O-methyltransferase, partial [Vicinamibacterales bacterium]
GSLYEQVRTHAWAGAESCYVLYTLASQALHLNGELWECGVYRGGTALLLNKVIESRDNVDRAIKLRLFDTFEGMPEVDPHRDLVRAGDFAGTSVEEVRDRVTGPHVSIHKGLIPETFEGLEQANIAFAHIDVDIYKSVWDCCSFIYERLVPGGFMIFDDYGFAECPGARQAVDEFFRGKPERPLVLPTSQAVVFSSCRAGPIQKA